jgi:hypothetical protein
MEIPKDREILEMTTSYIWIDDEGILYSKPKGGEETQQTPEQIRTEMVRFRKFIGNKKMCMVLESNPNSKPPTKEVRDIAAEELNSVTKAMAIITSSPLSKMIANLFFSFKPPTYPVKMFTNADEAREWVRQYLDKT